MMMAIYPVICSRVLYKSGAEKNNYDAHTLKPAIEQQQRLTGIILKNNFADRGYRGVKQVSGTNIIIPQNNPKDTVYQKQKLRTGFRRRKE